MKDLKFEITMLESEVTCLREELNEVTDAWAEEQKRNEILSKKLVDLEKISRHLIQVSAQNQKLREQLQKDERLQVENQYLKNERVKLSEKLQKIENTSARQQVARYKKSWEDEEKNRIEYQNKYFHAKFKIGEYKEEIKILNYRLSSPFMIQQRGKWKAISVLLAILLSINLLIDFWFLGTNLFLYLYKLKN